MQLDDDLKAHDEYVFQYMRNIKDDKNVMNIILRFSERGIEETILTELRPIIDKIKKACNIELRIMKSEVGDVMPSDINEAKDARAEIFLFNSKLSSQAASMLANFGMRQPHSHNLIHNFLKDVEESAYNMKRTSIKGTEKGRCEVLDVYQLKPDKRGNVMIVPGVVVTSGKMISAAHEFYIFRNNLPISEPFKVRTLKVFKKDVETVKKG